MDNKYLIDNGFGVMAIMIVAFLSLIANEFVRQLEWIKGDVATVVLVAVCRTVLIGIAFGLLTFATKFVLVEYRESLK